MKRTEQKPLEWSDVLVNVRKWANTLSVMAVVDSIRRKAGLEAIQSTSDPLLEALAAEREFERRYQEIESVMKRYIVCFAISKRHFCKEVADVMIAELLYAWREGAPSPAAVQAKESE